MTVEKNQGLQNVDNSETSAISFHDLLCKVWQGRLSQSVAHLIQEPEVARSISGLANTSISLFADSRRAIASYWREYVHLVLVNRLGGPGKVWLE